MIGGVTDLMQTPAAPTDAENLSRRKAVVVAMIEMLHVKPFHQATTEEVADRAGISLAELRVHFPTDTGLMLAAVDRWNITRMQPIMPLLASHGTVAFLHGIVASTMRDPALPRFLIALVNVAATPDDPAAPHLQSRWNDFRRLIQESLAKDVEVGREPSTMSPDSGAEQLVAIYEGLQLQFLVRPDMDLVASFDRAVTRLREGWRRSYIPPVWEIDAD
jgi:AcrR family transcriptional regulator